MSTTIKLVKEFHEAFGIKDSEVPKIVGLENGNPDFDYTVEESLSCFAFVLKNMAIVAHQHSEAHKKNVALLRIQLMIEELGEVIEAMSKNDIVNCLHELADLRYVCDGTALAFGLGDKLEFAVAEIHRANMSKLDDNGKPIINEAGRVVKSKNFVAADVSYLFKENVQ